MQTTVDLNSDLGESFGAWKMGEDEAMLGIVSSANVACGFHAGDPLVMWETCRLAKANGVAVGAHPSFLDLWGFGRRPIQGERPQDIMRQCVYQIGALQAVAAAVGHRVTHVKPHGSLGNMAAEDDGLALAVAEATALCGRELVLVAMPGSALERAGERKGLRVAREVFADRAYDDRGMLVSRKLPGAVLHDAEEAARRILRMLEEQAITSQSGKKIPARIDTICVHGDNPAAVAMARAIRAALERANVAIRPFVERLG
ncbi:MAG: 5-oxoprolinase subunit PxpA [Geminicoccaceae bacterium]|nr:5-oxoprolinase subunit PxpA [Geminicoccaceae bacterium]MCX8100518.1 5-oxoprolinase subunit PxpA [Geminicoccaceae bacterium]MDW8370273.1 5-oxoprolinase subunit PxpA [Geminicoccaceae bacterium]